MLLKPSITRGTWSRALASTPSKRGRLASPVNSTRCRSKRITYDNLRLRDPDLVERVLRMTDAAEYKRRQYPPGPKISVR